MNRILVNLLAVVLLYGCSNENKKEETAVTTPLSHTVSLTVEQRKNIDLHTMQVGRASIGGVLKVHGLIDVPPQNMVSISVPLGGYLKESHLLPGMHVKKGERIALIEDREYIELQQEYLTAAANLKFTEKEYERQQDLNASKATSDKVFQQITADYTARKVQVKALAEKLRLIGIDPVRLNEDNLSKSISINSPIDGYVTHVNANIGKYVRPEDVLFELVNPTDIHLALDVFEKDIDEIYVGQELVAYTNNHPEKKYPCEVILVGKDLTEDRSVEVHCHFKGNDPTLIPGLYMNADIRLRKKEGYIMPAQAVVQHDNRSYVFREVNDNNYELVEVKTGVANDGNVEVSWMNGEPSEKDRFVTEGAYALLMTMMNKAE